MSGGLPPAMGPMVPAMFSTSVLERRKSFDPAQMSGRTVGLFVDKENRQPELNDNSIKDVKEVVKTKDLGDWWLRQCQPEERLKVGPVARGKWQKRCEELEAESKAQAEQLSDLKDQLRREEEHRKEQAERFHLIMKGSEAVDRLAGLHKLQEQMQKLQEKCTTQEEQLQGIARRNAKVPQRSFCTQTDEEVKPEAVKPSQEALVIQQLKQELKDLRAELSEAQAEAEVRKKCSREVQEELQRDCDAWQRRAQALELVPSAEGCGACQMLLAEGRELSRTVAMLKDQCESLEVENQSLRSKVDSLQENLEYVSSSHAELAGHANHRQKIRHTIQLKTDRDNTREENYRLKQRIRQLEVGRSSQSIINAVAGYAGSTPDPKTPTTQRASKSGFRQPRFSGLETHRDAKDMMKIQQLEHQLERNRNNVMHFLVLIERAVAQGGDTGDAADLLRALRTRFLG